MGRHAHRQYPAASTIKLAMMTDLLLRNQPGAALHLTAIDKRKMFQALYTSIDHDADYLWYKFENASFPSTSAPSA